MVGQMAFQTSSHTLDHLSGPRHSSRDLTISSLGLGERPWRLRHWKYRDKNKHQSNIANIQLQTDKEVRVCRQPNKPSPCSHGSDTAGLGNTFAYGTVYLPHLSSCPSLTRASWSSSSFVNVPGLCATR